MHSLLMSVCLVGSAGATAYAQSEAELKDFFEGRSVRVKIDMPATQEGIDVYPDARRAIDFSQYSARLKSTGIAIRSGDSVLVTKVRVKDKLIEFQLAGGGFGTFGDDTSTSVSVPSVSKSRREKDLEKLVKDETDSARKRRLQRELDDLRNDREREDSRNRAAAASASEVKKARIATDRLHSGSRFNVRYQNGVPPGLGPDGVMRALAEYVEFPFATDRPDTPSRQTGVADTRRQMAGTGAIYKGMTMSEVEEALGKPEKTSDRNEGTLKVVTATYSRDDQRITAEFVEGVLIRYSISSK
jgi:hypothetical protein